MLSRFPFAHCHFKIGNSLLLYEFPFLKKTKVCKMFINSQNVKEKRFDFFSSQNTGILLLENICQHKS